MCFLIIIMFNLNIHHSAALQTSAILATAPKLRSGGETIVLDPNKVNVSVHGASNECRDIHNGTGVGMIRHEGGERHVFVRVRKLCFSEK